MFSGKRIKISSTILLTFFIILSSVCSATAISRGEVVYEIMNALDLPVVQEGAGFSDVSSSTLTGIPYRLPSLGILRPWSSFTLFGGNERRGFNVCRKGTWAF